MPSYFNEDNVVLATDNIWRSLQKINGRLLALAVAQLEFLGPLEEDCIPHAQDNPQRSLLKINALLNAMSGGGGGGGGFGGAGDPNGVIAAPQYSIYVDTNQPGAIWVKLTAGGSTGWASNQS